MQPTNYLVVYFDSGTNSVENFYIDDEERFSEWADSALDYGVKWAYLIDTPTGRTLDFKEYDPD